jgi:hypothetical protein
MKPPSMAQNPAPVSNTSSEKRLMNTTKRIPRIRGVQKTSARIVLFMVASSAIIAQLFQKFVTIAIYFKLAIFGI